MQVFFIFYFEIIITQVLLPLFARSRYQ